MGFILHYLKAIGMAFLLGHIETFYPWNFVVSMATESTKSAEIPLFFLFHDFYKPFYTTILQYMLPIDTVLES